ncbi:hypothetical protein EYZ11_007196 [Aspergillus tanneri]|uniref:Uncharacterized protein n=1 Tax=Aspergillus tanneri TaxID=1220188 RepID=A0A4S3JDW3_9EURO|nr:hypothetical protein EYZ11_007196 [Aspergillus tanneri]
MFVISYVAFLALLGSSVSAFGSHAAKNGLLQVPPSFARDGIFLYPALHPEHDPNDLNHLVPENSKQLYYSQEGHRPALHGSKHAQLQPTFSYPTAVLEHSSHIKDVTCHDGHIKVCFKTHEALQTVEKSWKHDMDSEIFHLITYHVGCGHLTGEQRSIFRATQPVFNEKCVTVAAELLDPKEAFKAGELSWGTYVNPHIAKRQPVKGHIRAAAPEGTGGNDTVNLTEDAKAVKYFFGTDQINTDIPSTYMTGLDSLSDDEYEDHAISNFFKGVVDRVEAAVNIVIKIAAVTVKLLLVPFGVPFNEAYHADMDFDHRAGGGRLSTDLGSALSMISDNFVVSQHGAGASIKCVSCGAKGKFTFDGKLAFDVSHGISRAEVSFINHDPFLIDAIFALTVDARAFKTKPNNENGFSMTAEKQIAAVPLSPFTIPTIITLGPEVSVNVAASIYFDAHGEFTAGARFSISEGRLVLNVTDKDRNEASGFKPSLEPVFNMTKGNIVATADLALPVGLELGVDVLMGTWKKTIGVFDAPSVYLTAGHSKGEGHACDGVEFRAGAKERVYSSALGIWEYEFKELGRTFYETGIGCLSANGWDAQKVEPSSGFFAEVAESLGGVHSLPSSKTLNLTRPGPIIHEDEHFEEENEKKKHKLRKLPKTNGFRLIQDAQQTAILVSGTDGKMYMVDNSVDYDVSAPWGAMDLKKDIFSYDVFGRLIYYNASQDFSVIPGFNATVNSIDSMLKELPAEARKLYSGLFDPNVLKGGMVELGVARAEEMPKAVRVATLSVLKGSQDTSIYGVAFNGTFVKTVLGVPVSGPEEIEVIWFPTVCQDPGQGLRLYASKYLVDENGNAKSEHNYNANLQYDMDRLILNLDSKRKGEDDP